MHRFLPVSYINLDHEYRCSCPYAYKEVAKAWIESIPHLPFEILETLRTNSDIGEIENWWAEPEARLKFDTLRGEPPNLDLFVVAEDSKGIIVMAVEAKADESFSKTLDETYRDALSRLKKNPRSGGVTRLEKLLKSLIGVDLALLSKFGKLRYQLLTATAGLLSAAKKERAKRAILLIHEFRTNQTIDNLHSINQLDLNDFVRVISNGKYNSINNRLIGPIRHCSEITDYDDVHFYIGKVVRELRNSVT